MVPQVLSLAELVQIAAPGQEIAAAQRLFKRLPADAPGDWRRLAVALALRTVASGRRVFGISGGQGAGKTTLAHLTCEALQALGVNSLSLSLDDFYLSRARRAELAGSIHPLLATRGVPGTHDVVRARAVIAELLAGVACEVPVFDKARDDQGAVRRIDAAVEVVVFEGWCLGVRPQPPDALTLPCNPLEALEDGEGHWRGFVNERLRLDYPALWSLIDDLLFLAVPDISAVHRWRAQQEAGLVSAAQRDAAGLAAGMAAGMDEAQLTRFIAHYERLTLWALEDLPRIANLTGHLDGHHALVRLDAR